MRAWIALAVLALAAGPARAGGASDELSAGSLETSAGGPRSTWTADKLGAIWDASDDWQLRFDLTATHDFATRPATGFGDSGGNIWLANLSIEYDPDSHWSLRGFGGGSPSATLETGTTVPLASATADAQLESTASSVTAGASAGYETGDLGAWETSAVVTVTGNAFDSLQQITDVMNRTGQMESTQQVKDYCASHRCSAQLTGALDAQDETLGELVLDASLSEQIHRNTDVGIDGAYYLYDKDPTQLGYFALTAVGRTATGAGMPIAPLQFTVAPDLVQRWGGLMAMASCSYGQYVDAQGSDVSATLRLQYRFKLDAGRRLKLWSKLIVSRDIDDSGNVLASGSLSLGAQYSW
ncbi:MAG TPA: hypothetical protein VLX92_06160 [Kofleriaceae bacterium]|nr:hypothetical protein [Kofleriaceae bacterium]